MSSHAGACGADAECRVAYEPSTAHRRLFLQVFVGVRGAGRAGAPCHGQPFVCAHPTKVERAQRKLITRTSYVPVVGARRSTISLVLSQLEEKTDPLGPRTSRSRSALGR